MVVMMISIDLVLLLVPCSFRPLVVYSKNNVNPCEDPGSWLFKLEFERRVWLSGGK